MTNITHLEQEAAGTVLTARLRDHDVPIEHPDTAVRDRSEWRPAGAPLVIVRPRDTDDVASTLRAATELSIPVATRGAGSGLAGGSIASPGWIQLDLSHLREIIDIDVENQLATVQPGVSATALDEAIKPHGLRYAPDPASVAISSLGGNIATNAGGFRALKYGVTRDAVRTVTIVTGDGRVLRTGSKTQKGVVGYDLVSLITGSEGTLGVITEATVQLQPIPVASVTLAAFFASVEDAAAAAAAVLASSVTPSLCELLDAATLRAIDASEGTGLSAQGSAFVLLQTDGWGAESEAQRVLELITPFATSVERAASPEEVERLLETRRRALPSLERLGRLLIEDIAVPISRLAEAVRGIERIGREHGVQLFTMGHAGDGNLHPIILVPTGADADEDAALEAAAQEAADAIFGFALELGGTISAEHGVGIVKRAWGQKELGETSLQLHAAIKNAFDPAGILNPGKGF